MPLHMLTCVLQIFLGVQTHEIMIQGSSVYAEGLDIKVVEENPERQRQNVAGESVSAPSCHIKSFRKQCNVSENSETETQCSQ